MERKLNLKIGTNKIKLFTTELEAFGIQFDANGMKPTNKRIKTLLEQKILLLVLLLLSGQMHSSAPEPSLTLITVT